MHVDLFDELVAKYLSVRLIIMWVQQAQVGSCLRLCLYVCNRFTKDLLIIYLAHAAHGAIMTKDLEDRR